MKERIHEKLVTHCEALVDWYQKRLESAYVPFYSSYDVRDAAFKISNVDGNIFPAGFNNICQVDKDNAPEAMETFLKKKYPDTKKILILTEEHLKNLYYWENVIAICQFLDEAGYEVRAGMISENFSEKTTITSFSGKEIEVHPIFSKEGQLQTEGFSPDLVISNNDFSRAYEETDFSKTTVIPAKELGWYQRKKHCYFKYYNEIAKEFAAIIDEDPWLFSVTTHLFNNFDVANEESRKDLAGLVDNTLGEIAAKYKEHGIDAKPYVFIKNNAGTYGLGVIEAHSGEDIINWNYKSKKKMKAAKGGGGIGEVIVQEGVPTALTEGDASAEPVIYMVGDDLVGGFLRTHEKKDAQQSLNSPGAVYKKLCLSDLKVRMEGCPLENVYGWVAKIGLLAITEEAKAHNL